MKLYAAGLVASAILATPSSAVTVKSRVNNFCETEAVCSDGGGKIVMKLDVGEMTGTEIDLTFKAFGDLDARREGFKVKVDGLNLGKFLNNRRGDDRLRNRNRDRGNFYDSVNVAKATLTTEELGDALDDGTLRIVFKPLSNRIGDETPAGTREEFVMARASFDVAPQLLPPVVSAAPVLAPEIAPVPLPASVWFMFVALGGLGVLTRRKRG